MEINKYIDHTLLSASATVSEIGELCAQAEKYNFHSVCVNPCYVNYCKNQLIKSQVAVCTVVGFPLGANTTKIKVYEAKQAIKSGAKEIDFVINVGALKSKNRDLLLTEFTNLRKVTHGYIIKAILETNLLTTDEIFEVCRMALSTNLDFVKTSTGFNGSFAKVSDIHLMKEAVGDAVKIKASGGIKTYEDALKMINAGASRIGTSNGIKIISETNKGETVSELKVEVVEK